MRNLTRFGAVVALPAFLMLVSIPDAKAQFVVVDPVTDANTTAMTAKQILQYVQEAATALNTLTQLNYFIREVQQLATHPSTNIGADLATFSGILQQSQVLAMNVAQMDAVFQNNFAPYSPSPIINYAAQYNSWASSALNALRAAGDSAAGQGTMIQNEQLFMQTMNGMNNAGDNGMDQSLQIGNSITMEIVAQLQRLRMLTIANIQQNAVIATTVLNAQQANVLTQTNLFTDNGTIADQRGW